MSASANAWGVEGYRFSIWPSRMKARVSRTGYYTVNRVATRLETSILDRRRPFWGLRQIKGPIFSSILLEVPSKFTKAVAVHALF